MTLSKEYEVPTNLEEYFINLIKLCTEQQFENQRAYPDSKQLSKIRLNICDLMLHTISKIDPDYLANKFGD